jgi:NitT/TauT family transport system ATP-binding protein
MLFQTEKKMNVSVKNISFKFSNEKVFNNFSIDFSLDNQPLVILGPSGSGKTTLLKLLGGLLKPQDGGITFSETRDTVPDCAFVFQEPRLLPWLTVLENVSLPLEKQFGKEGALERAKHFLSLVFLEDKMEAYPGELSGGQAQRVSMARAFAWPAPALFMDEPYQELDIPLKISMMDLSLSVMREEKRSLITVTHDPREAVYLGGRIIVLGKRGEGIVFDKLASLPEGQRFYGSPATGGLEKELIHVLQGLQS